MRPIDRLAIIWVSGFGTGFIPKLLRLPGVGGATWGSFGALILCMVVIWFAPSPLPILIGLSALHVIGSALLIEHVEQLLGPQPDPKGRMRIHDQNQIVIDEWLAVFLMNTGILWGFKNFGLDFGHLIWAMIFGTFLFRVIDILKPWPLSQLERLGGWVGVIADDVVGGVVCIPVTLLLAYFLR